MLDDWPGLVVVGGAAELAGGRQPHGIACATAGLSFARLMAVGGNEAFLLCAQGGADEVGADFTSLKGVALAEVPIDCSGLPGNDRVEALLVVEDHSAEGAVVGGTDIHVAVLDEAFAALSFLIGDGLRKSVEDGHFSRLRKYDCTEDTGIRVRLPMPPQLGFDSTALVQSGRCAGPSNVTEFWPVVSNRGTIYE